MKTNKNLNILKPWHPNITVGRYCYGSPELRLWNDQTDFIHIGSFCSFADEIMILGGGEHRTDWMTAYPFRIVFDLPLAGKDGTPTSKGIISIGNDVWVGSRSTILSGVCVGDGAVIGAGSVVTQDVPLYSIVAGNPAKVIKQRFSSHIIKNLVEMAWWDWPIEKIIANVDILCSNNFDLIKLIK